MPINNADLGQNISDDEGGKHSTALNDMTQHCFTSKVRLIHTRLQPGVKVLMFSRNRFNGFPPQTRGKPLKRFDANASVYHRAKARCE